MGDLALLAAVLLSKDAVDRCTGHAEHDLRHTAASLAISGGANPKAVQTMLGHQSAVLTMDTYADLYPDDLELVSTALDKAQQAALNRTADRLRLRQKKSPTRTAGQGL